jgi:hypothetical protein
MTETDPVSEDLCLKVVKMMGSVQNNSMFIVHAVIRNI